MIVSYIYGAGGRQAIPSRIPYPDRLVFQVGFLVWWPSWRQSNIEISDIFINHSIDRQWSLISCEGEIYRQKPSCHEQLLKRSIVIVDAKHDLIECGRVHRAQCSFDIYYSIFRISCGLEGGAVAR